jgi:phosphoribosyl 1,2-cyclic phosphate phosphodiesterase
MRVTILGCGGSAGVPHIGGPNGLGDWGACDPAEPRNRRTRSSIVVESGQGQRLLVDTSPDMRNQLLACGVPHIDAIFFTHAHADHITGLDDVRILNRIIDRPIEAFATERTLSELAQRFDYAFRPWQPPWFFRPVLENHPFQFGDTIDAAGLRIRTFEQDHGYMPTAGMRIGSFGYSTDVVALSDAAFDVLSGVDTWVVDCFQRQPHKTHINFENVLVWAKRVGARRTILTHMGPDMDWEWLQKRLPAGVEPGVDGLAFDLPDGT